MVVLSWLKDKLDHLRLRIEEVKRTWREEWDETED